MRFPSRTPSPRRCHRPPRAVAGALRILHAALLAAIAVMFMTDGSLAEEFELGQLTDNIDIALSAGREPIGELTARFALAGLGLDLHHTEFMGGMARPWHYERPKSNPAVRSTFVDSGALIGVAPGAALPLGISFGQDERRNGNRNLRMIARKGIHLESVRLDHRLTVATEIAPDGSRTRSTSGRLVLGLNFFGGRQEGVAEYGASPQPQMTQFRMKSEWRIAEAAAAVVGVSHRPLRNLSEARVAFRQPVGAFTMTSDAVADSAGGYAAGLRFTLPLGAAPKRVPWSLSALVANLRAERQPPVP